MSHSVAQVAAVLMMVVVMMTVVMMTVVMTSMTAVTAMMISLNQDLTPVPSLILPQVMMTMIPT